MSNEEAQNELRDELLSAYVDGELSPEVRDQVEERLRSDSQARRLVEEMRALSGAMRALPREKFAGDLRPRVWAGVEEADSPVAGKIEPPPRDRWQGFRRGLAWSAVAIAATLVLMVVQPEGNEGNRELARVDAPSDSPAEEESELAAPAPRLRRGPPEMRAAAPATAALEEAATREGEAGAAPSAETLAGVASDLAEPPAAVEAPAASSGAPASAVSQAVEQPAGLATIEATALAPDSLRKFEAYLEEHRIEIREARDADNLPPEAPTLAAGETALLVEAAPAQVAALYRDMQADRAQFAAVRIRDERSRGQYAREGALAEGRTMAKTAERQAAQDRDLSDVLAEAAMREKSPADADPLAIPGRAWRVGPEGATMIADAYAARPAAPANGAAESLSASSGAARGLRKDDGSASADLIRVWFVLRSPQE